MKRYNILYALIISFLFFGFISFLESKKNSISLIGMPEENSFLFHQWVVAEAVDPLSLKDHTDRFGAEVWQFLQSGGFVQFNNDIIENTGEWKCRKGQIILSSEEESEPKIYQLEKVRGNELVLSSNEIKIRLLKLK